MDWSSSFASLFLKKSFVTDIKKDGTTKMPPTIITTVEESAEDDADDHENGRFLFFKK